jgi:subtilase-type serine protease
MFVQKGSGRVFGDLDYSRGGTMKFRKAYLALAAVGFISACNHTGTGSGGQGYLLDSVFSSYFVPSYLPTDEALAATLRNSPKYSIQQWTWDDTGYPWRTGNGLLLSNSLKTAGVEYAHAVKLTGVGQTIAIVDNGFLRSHDELTGKTMWYSTGYQPGVADHGTTVASIAAGMGVSGKMIGVAPGANLMLTDFNFGDAVMAQGNYDAITHRAIVQNNSWGYELDVSNANFQWIFNSNTASRQYYDSLVNLAQNAVIVWAMSNEDTRQRTHAGIVSGLPVLVPSLEKSWLAVINAVPSFSGGAIASAALVSSQCYEAARWCIAADGNVYGAIGPTLANPGNSNYKYWGGTSFAAPQVSGAIALLAEAFPTLNAQQLRARLLASANNRFFQNTGYVQFSPSVRHGYNSKFGHGFLDIKAALLPIGGSYVPMSNGGTLDVTKPVLLSGGMVGDAVVASLSREELSLTDGLGAGFEVPASVLTAQTAIQFDPIATINGLLAVDLQGDAADPFQSASAFSETLPGQELNFQAQDTKVALLIPALGSPDANFGVSAAREFQLGQGNISLGLSAARESGGFAGLKSMVPGAALSGTHAAATFDWGIPVGLAQEIRLSGSLGLAMPDGGLSDMAVSNVSYNSLKLTYGAQNVWGAGDRLSVGVSMPQAVQSGSAKFMLPMALSNGQTAFQTADVSLAPVGRQIDLSISYGMPLSNRSQVVMSAVRSLNNGNILGQNTSQAAIGIRVAF